MVSRFRLVAEDGADLGTFATVEPNWTRGQRIHRAAGVPLEVVRLVDAEAGDDVDGYLIVRLT